MKRDRKEKFSIRKFSFGAASCLIGATIAMTSLSSKEVQAMSTTVVGDNGGTSVIYANWDDNPLKTNTNSKVSVNDEIVIKVDTSGYTKTRPIVTVTYYFNKNFMQNADGSITPTGTNNNIVRRGEVSWLGHRPDYWFTVPKGFSEPTSLVLTNARGINQYNNWAAWRNSNSRGVASRYQSETDAKAMNNGSPDNWSRYNDHTQEGPIWEHNGSLNWYLNTRAGYRWDEGSDKEAYERLRNNTRSIYSDWENTGAAGAEIQVTYEVKDPVNTQYIELGAGVHINAGGIDHIKIETIALPDVDDTPENQKYEPNKLPARQGVKDVTSLTPQEKTTLKEALKEKNPLLENRLKGGLENGISIDNDGTATFTYTDNTTDTIPGKDLVYKEFKLKLNPDILINGIPYKVEQVAVENYEAISYEDRKRADAKLGELNGFTPDYTKNNYPIGLFNRSTVRNNTDYKLKNQDFAKWENDKLRIGGAEYFGRGSGYNELIPKDVLFAQIPKADNNAKQKGKDLINGLQNLTDAEKDEYKKKIDQLPANSSEDKINEIVNDALKKDAENKVLKEAKKEAKKVVATLPNLTNEEKDAAKREIDNATTTDAVTTAKNNAIAKDLEKEKDKAKKRIDQIKDNLANPDDYKNQITAAKTKDEIAAIVRRAEDEAAKKQVEKNKTEADKVRDEAKRKIDAIPGLTEAEKKHFKDLIDGANTKGQIDKIVEAAKQYADSKAKREAVKKEIENLPHLNKAQKADFIESINATDDIPTISDISTKAHNLDARMGRLQDLVKYAKGNEVTDKYSKSDSAKKQVFDEAKKAAEKIADKENATDNAGVDLVQKLYKDLEDAIKKLGIDPVVLKTNKDALKAEVALNDNDAIKKGNPYKLATSDEKRAAYDRAFEKAKDVLNREQATQDEINQAVRDLQNARYALDGKVADFTLKTTGVAEISVKPQEGTTLTSDADKNLVKSKVRVTQSGTEGNVLDTDEVFYGNITSKDGKFYVPVTVGRDKVYHIVDVEVKEFTLAVKDTTKPAEISKTPVAGESLTAEDQAKVKEKVTANNEALKDTDKVTYGPIKEKDGKKVVPVTVTRDGVAKTIDVEVTKKAEGFTLAVKDATKPAEISKTPVAGESLTAEDQAKVKEKVTANNEVLKDTDKVTYGPIKEKDGKKVVPVTVTRDGVAKTVEVLVVKKEDSTDSSGSQGNQDGQGGSGSQGNQNGQGGQGGSGSQGNQNGQGENADSNTEGPTSPGISADQTDLDKAKDKAKADLTVAANKEKAEIDADKNLTDKEKADKKAEVDKVKKAQEANIDKAQTTDEVAKATEEGKKAIDAVHQTELEKAQEKEQAKADLTEAANKEKAEIDADKNLTDKEKADKKAEVDKVKKEQEANIDKAQTTDEVEKATEEGKKVIDAVHQTELDKAKEKAKADLTEAAAKEKAEIDADKNLTDQQKTDKKTEVDNAKKAAEANIDKATTPEEVAKATEDGKKAIDAVHQITPDQAKADLTDAANTEKGEIGGDATLTDKEKGDLKAKVDEVKKAAEDKINNAKTPEEIAKAAEEGKKAIADVYNPQTGKGKSTSIFKPELDLQTALVSGKATVEKGKDLTDEEILKQLALADGVTAKITSKPTTTETGTKEAEVEVTLADGTKVTVKVPVEVVASLDIADKDNDLAKAKEDAKKQVEDAAKAKIDEINKAKDLTEDQKQKAEEAINKAKEEANKAIDEASSAGTAKQIADEAKENIEKYNPKADTEVKKPDVTNLDEEKAKAKAEILEEAQKRINEIKNNKDVSDEEKQKAIDAINKAKDKAIEDINKGQSKDEIDAAKDNGIKKINEVQPEGSIASQFEPKVPENKVEVKNSTKLSDEEREKVRQNIEGVNTFPDGTTVDVKADGTAVITYKDGSSDTISKDKLVAPAKKDEGTIASRTEPVIPGKTQVGNTTKLTPEEQAAVKKAVEDANNFPAGTTVEVRPDGTVVITYPDKSVDTITGDKLVEKGSKQETPKVKTEAEKNPAQVPGSFVPVENTHSLTQAEQSEVAAKVKQANPTATVTVSKDGTATLTYGDGSVNTIPGTSLVVARDTEKEAATQAAQNPAVVPATTEVGNAHSLTPAEQSAVAAKVKQVNPTATDVKVSKDGTATLTYGDGSVNTIPGTSLVVQKEEVPAQDQPTIAEKTKVIIPVNPTKVAETTRLTDIEKEAVKKAVVEANGFGSDVNVEVAGDGTATIIFSDGSAITIPGSQLVAQDSKAQDSNKTDAEKTTVKAPAQRVEVKDITHLTDAEKEKVKAAILQANGSALDGVTIEVAGDGTAIITFPDGSVATILGKDTIQQSAKIEPTIEEKPEYTPESTPGQDNGGNTGRLDDNANSGNGSDAGAANAGDNNASKEDAKGALAHTGLDNASGLGLSGLGLAMLGGVIAARRRKEK